MSTPDIIEFWEAFCAAQNISDEAYQRGSRLIEVDPDYWQGASMWNLWEIVK